MTKPLVITISHELGAAEARRRIEGNLSRVMGKVPGGGSLREDWTGNRMSFEARAIGQSVSGHVDVEDAAVRLEVNLPPFLASLAEAYRSRIQQAGAKLLGKR